MRVYCRYSVPENLVAAGSGGDICVHDKGNRKLKYSNMIMFVVMIRAFATRGVRREFNPLPCVYTPSSAGSSINFEYYYY